MGVVSGQNIFAAVGAPFLLILATPLLCTIISMLRRLKAKLYSYLSLDIAVSVMYRMTGGPGSSLLIKPSDSVIAKSIKVQLYMISLSLLINSGRFTILC